MIIDQAMAEFPEPRRIEIQEKYRRLHKLYWDARQKWSNWLQEHDPGLFRLVVPMDPIITGAPDVLFFECFCADERCVAWPSAAAASRRWSNGSSSWR
jgi:hypothetical protein